MNVDDLTRLLNRIVDAAYDTIPEKSRRKFYVQLIEVAQDAGWDAELEIVGADPAYDRALKQVWKTQGHPRLGELLDKEI